MAAERWGAYSAPRPSGSSWITSKGSMGREWRKEIEGRRGGMIGRRPPLWILYTPVHTDANDTQRCAVVRGRETWHR